MRIRSNDISEFFLEFSLLIDNDIPPAEAVELIHRGQDQPAMRRLLKNVAHSLNAGHSLADSLSEHPGAFPTFLTDMIREAESHQRLPETLQVIAAYRERLDSDSLETAYRFRVALIYPVLMLAIAGLVTAVLMIFVIPVFKSMFADFGADLPALTRLIITASEYWYVGLAIFVVPGYFILAPGDGVIQRLKNRFALHFYGIGSIYQHTTLARVLYTWSFMFKHQQNWAAITAASAQVAGDALYKNELQRLSTAVAGGQPITTALDNSRYFPRKVKAALEAAVRSSNPAAFFDKLAERYNRQARILVEPGVRVLSLVLMIFLWVVIGLLVIGMYLPIFKMGQVI